MLFMRPPWSKQAYLNLIEASHMSKSDVDFCLPKSPQSVEKSLQWVKEIPEQFFVNFQIIKNLISQVFQAFPNKVLTKKLFHYPKTTCIDYLQRARRYLKMKFRPRCQPHESNIKKLKTIFLFMVFGRK